MNTNAQEFLNQIRIASPCTASWNKMEGDNRVRDCGQCQKKVYNLSALTAQQAADLVKEKEGKLCVKFYRRFDGTLLTSDCPVGLKERARWFWWRTTTVVASLMAMVFVAGCKSKTRPVQPEDQLTGEMIQHSEIMGGAKATDTYELQELKGKPCPPKQPKKS